MKARTTRSVLGVAIPLRLIGQRFSFIACAVVAIALLLLSRLQPTALDGIRAHVMDGFTPVLAALAHPATAAAEAIEWFGEIGRLQDDNNRLKEENSRLLQWQQAALRLEADNNDLRRMLKFHPEPGLKFITARVIGDPGGAFVRTFLITAGAHDGVKKGQAAIAEDGLIGRVVDVGEWSSRVLLITDLNERIPVMMESSRYRAVLSGDNSAQPRLLYLPRDAAAVVGERVVTSGTGGMIPPGLPIGTVSVADEHGVIVKPLVDLSRIEYVRLVDFNLPGGLENGDIVSAPLGKLP